MAGERILFPQFREEQSDSKYPFSDDATLRVPGSSLTIARDAFIDASLHPIGARGQMYISGISVTPFEITITLGDGGNTKRCTTKFDPATPPNNGVLELTDEYGRPAGMLLSTPLALSAFGGWPAGAYQLRATDSGFVSSVVIPATEPGVRAIRPDTKEFITGDMWLIGNRGVVVRKEGEHVIRIDIVGEPLFKRYLCAPQDKFNPPTFVQTINGCGPDEFGNFLLTATNHQVGDPVLRVYPDGNLLRIETIGRKVV